MPGAIRRAVEGGVVGGAGVAIAAGGAHLLVDAMPTSVIRFGYWLTDSRHTLRTDEDIQAFDALYQIIQPMSQELPGTRNDFTELFSEYSKEHGCVYVFSQENCFSLETVMKALQTRSNFNGRKYVDCSLRNEILTQMSGLSSLKETRGQSVAKILFRYIASVALELPYLHTSHDKLELIQHLNEVILKSKTLTIFTDMLKQPEKKALASMQQSFEAFISDEYAMHKANDLKDAIEKLNKIQYTMASTSLRLLILLTEGGNKDSITVSSIDIENNIAHREMFGPGTTPFTSSNPLYPLIKEVARLLPGLQNQYTRKINFEQLYVPQIDSIKRYLKTHLRSRYHLGPFNATSPLARYLNITLINSDKVEISSLEGEEQSAAYEAAISENAEVILTAAKWVRFHIIICDKIAIANYLFNRLGDQIFHSIFGVPEMKALIQQYQNKLTTFNQEMNNLSNFLSDRESDLRGRGKADRGLLELITSELSGYSRDLPKIFETIQRSSEHVHERQEAIETEIARLFGWIMMPQIELGSTFISSVAPRYDADTLMVMAHAQPPALSTLQGQVPEISNKLNDIQAFLIRYASSKKYKFYLPHHEASNRISIPSGLLLDVKPEGLPYSIGMHIKNIDKHKYRAGWVYDCLSILFSDKTNEEKLALLQNDLLNATKRPTYVSAEVLLEITQLTQNMCIQDIIQVEFAHQGALLAIENGEEDMPENVNPALDHFDHEDALQQTPIVPQVEYSKIGFFDIPVEASDTIKFLANLISFSFPDAKVDSNTKRDFIPFWIELCFLNQSNFLDGIISNRRQVNQMEKYQSLSGIQQRKEPEQNYLDMIKDMQNKEELKQWVKKNITQLRMVNGDIQSATMSDTAFIDALVAKLLKQHNNVSDAARDLLNQALGSQNTLVWSDEIHHMLKQKAFMLVRGADDASIAVNLSVLSKFIKRDKGTKPSDLDYKALDIMLTYTLEKGRDALSSNFDDLHNPWLLVAQGLVRFGGDPLPWLEEQILETGDIKPHSETSFLMMAQVTHSILTSQVCRSKFSGESGLILGEAWDDFFNATHAFALRLYDYSESNTNPIWGVVWPIMEWFGATDTNHFVTERIVIYWSVLSLARSCLNKQSGVEKLSIEFVNEVEALKLKLTAFKERVNIYALPGSNRGSKSANDLYGVINVLEVSLIKMAVLREQKVGYDSSKTAADERVNALELDKAAAKEETAAAKEETAAAKERLLKKMTKKIIAAQLLTLESRHPSITQAQFVLDVIQAVLDDEDEVFKPDITRYAEEVVSESTAYHAFFAPALDVGSTVVVAYAEGGLTR